jgi:hypothetical protein
MRSIFVVLLVLLMCSMSFADSHERFARRLNFGPLRHARIGYSGPEVVFRSSGPANREQALQWWAQSPPHAALINSGQITTIICNGRVCVGR